MQSENDKTPMNRTERLKWILRNRFYGRTGKMSEYLGIKTSVLYSWIYRDSMDFEKVARIPGINLRWLLTGEGCPSEGFEEDIEDDILEQKD